MNRLTIMAALGVWIPGLVFSEDAVNEYLTRSHLNQVPPSLDRTPNAPSVNSEEGLTLRSLRGRLVLVLFTSTG